MNRQDFFAAELPELEARWREGYFPAMREAFLLCTINAEPIPPWLAEAVNEQLALAFDPDLKAKAQGKGGGHLVARGAWKRTSLDDPSPVRI